MKKEKLEYGNHINRTENRRSEKERQRKETSRQKESSKESGGCEKRTAQVGAHPDQGRKRQSGLRARKLVQVSRLQGNDQRPVVVQETSSKPAQVDAERSWSEGTEIAAQLRRALMTKEEKRIRRAAFRWLGGIRTTEIERILNDTRRTERTET
jgi:hypothetical protein